jgi:nucleotide-binding universal stress UspA family protein
MAKILVPTDFSEYAGNALQVALELARALQAELHILHAVEPVSPSMGMNMPGTYPDFEINQEFVNQQLEASRQKMSGLVSSLSQEGIAVVHNVVANRLFTEIENYVNTQHIDLVVMGTKGASGLKEFFIGSNAERVVRDATCPVITVNKRPAQFKLKRIAYATGVEKELHAVPPMLLQLQKYFDAHLAIVNVATPGSFISEKQIRAQLMDWVQQQGLQNYSINIVDDMDEEKGVTYFAEQVGADMIALGTRGRKGLSRLISGSIAEDIVNHSLRPVFTYNVKISK